MVLRSLCYDRMNLEPLNAPRVLTSNLCTATGQLYLTMALKMSSYSIRCELLRGTFLSFGNLMPVSTVTSRVTDKLYYAGAEN